MIIDEGVVYYIQERDAKFSYNEWRLAPFETVSYESEKAAMSEKRKREKESPYLKFRVVKKSYTLEVVE